MPLRKELSRTFHRGLYGTILQPIVLLKRNDDQQEGTVRALTIWDCRRGIISKTGEQIQADMTSNHRVTWHFPVTELERQGVQYLNSTDRIIDDQNWWWEPESTTGITVKLFTVWCNVDCLRIDPTPNLLKQAIPNF